MHHIDIETITLVTGAHSSPEHGVCVMEAAAWLSGGPFSDHPPCVSPVLGDFLRPWNDALDDETRQRLRAYIPRLLNTAGDKAADTRRREMVWEWVIGTWLPAWLRLAKLDEVADDLVANGEKALYRAKREAAAAWDAAGAAGAASREAAWDAAWDAARDAAWNAARAAARAAARDAAGTAAGAASRDAAWNAAWNAARAAAWNAARAAAGAGAAAGAAARAALKPTVLLLQESAFGLLDRMIDVCTEVGK